MMPVSSLSIHQSYRILVVDDMPDNLNLLSVVLGQKGYEVRRAPNGSLALANVPRYHPHVILLDIMMPGMDGYEVCKRLKSDPNTAHIPIIFLSALNETFDKVKAFQLGGADYITKPFEMEEVLMRVQQQLYLQSLQSQLQEKNAKLQIEVEDRRKAEEIAFQASQAKSYFLARMSHELRTPLSTIIGYADLLLSDSDRSETDRQCLNAILTSSSHLLNLIEDVLNMTSIESGRISLDESVFNLPQFLTDLENMFRLQSDRKNLEFKIEINPSLPEWIQTDEIKLRQVLINLVSNALKFTDQGSVIVKTDTFPCGLAWEDQAAYACLLQFQIQDTGLGIASAEQDRLFQPFEQTTSGRLSKKGSGLGLAISRNFIRLMGGEIWVNSFPNEGTCFTIEVMVKATHSRDKQSLQTLEVMSSIQPFFSPWRILVNLNQICICDWLPQLLCQAGYDTRITGNFDEILLQWKTWKPHILLLEWGINREEILQFIKAIRTEESDRSRSKDPESKGIISSTEHPFDTIILGVAINEMNLNPEQAVKDGFDQLLIPPHRPHNIIEAIQTGLSRRKVMNTHETTFKNPFSSWTQ